MLPGITQINSILPVRWQCPVPCRLCIGLLGSCMGCMAPEFMLCACVRGDKGAGERLLKCGLQVVERNDQARGSIVGLLATCT